MFCDQCGKEIPNNVNYCPKCGNKISKGDIKPPKKKRVRSPIIVLGLLGVLAIFAVVIWGKNIKLMGIPLPLGNDSEDVYVLSENDTVWSTNYLFWYANNLDKDVKSFIKDANTMLKDAEALKAETYLKLDDGWFGSGSYEITSDQTEYGYAGGIKKNQPSGFGVLYKYYYFGMDLEMYIPVYIGDFKKGKFNGEGILFCDYSEEDDVVSSIAYSLDMNEDNMENIIYQYLHSISYIGEFKDNQESGKGVFFEYPSIHTFAYAGADVDPDILDMNSITVYVGKYKDGKMEDHGKVYYHQHLLYDGEFKEGLMNGQGTAYYPDSDQTKYKGEFKDNMYHGQGTLYSESGDVIYKGKWSNGDYTK